MYQLGQRSKSRLEGVHQDLVKVVKRAIEISRVDFSVIEGVRTVERQKELVKKGASKTMRSRHLSGHAVDLGAWVDGKLSWDVEYYHKISYAMKQAAKELDVQIEWGGDWKSFFDGPHFQLSHKQYPVG